MYFIKKGFKIKILKSNFLIIFKVFTKEINQLTLYYDNISPKKKGITLIPNILHLTIPLVHSTNQHFILHNLIIK